MHSPTSAGLKRQAPPPSRNPPQWGLRGIFCSEPSRLTTQEIPTQTIEAAAPHPQGTGWHPGDPALPPPMGHAQAPSHNALGHHPFQSRNFPQCWGLSSSPLTGALPYTVALGLPPLHHHPHRGHLSHSALGPAASPPPQLPTQGPSFPVSWGLPPPLPSPHRGHPSHSAGGPQHPLLRVGGVSWHADPHPAALAGHSPGHQS